MPEPKGPDSVLVRIDDPEQYRQVDPEASLVPVHITGQLAETREGQRLELAIAINGTIRAVTRSHTIRFTAPQRGEVRFTAMVPESVIEAGANRVEVFVIQGDPGAASLQATRGRPRKKNQKAEKKRRSESVSSG